MKLHRNGKGRNRTDKVRPEFREDRTAHEALLAWHHTDDRFLSVHPATVRWWAQRDQCARCAHKYLYDPGDPYLRAERCAAGRAHSKLDVGAYPIDMRLPSGKCGPAATMFVPATQECESGTSDIHATASQHVASNGPEPGVERAQGVAETWSSGLVRGAE